LIIDVHLISYPISFILLLDDSIGKFYLTNVSLRKSLKLSFTFYFDPLPPNASIVDDPKLIPLVIIPPTGPSAGASKFAAGNT
jgi:hypothetical protein